MNEGQSPYPNELNPKEDFVRRLEPLKHRFTPRQWEALVLRNRYGWKNKDVAKKWGVNTGTASRHYINAVAHGEWLLRI